jgi:hypothetical protein
VVDFNVMFIGKLAPKIGEKIPGKRGIFHKVEAYSTFLNVPQLERQGAHIINKYITIPSSPRS